MSFLVEYAQWGIRRLQRWATFSSVVQDFETTLNLEQAAEMANTQEQDIRTDHDADMEEEDIEFRHPSLSDDEGSDEDAEDRPQFTTHNVRDEARSTMDEEGSAVDRAGPTLAEVQSLGPIEELETALFEKVEREVPAGSGTKKDVFLCKFCGEEFSYMMRDMHTHKDVCAKYPGRQGMVRDVRSVPDNDDPEFAVDVEVVGEAIDAGEEINGPDAPMVNDDDAEGDKGVTEEDADLVHDENDDETQMLDDELPTVLVPDRVEMPSDSDEPRPRLKVAKAGAFSRIDSSGDIEMVEEHTDSETEENAKTLDRSIAPGVMEAHDSPEPTSETASTGSAYGSRDTYRGSFTTISNESGEHTKCRQCGRVCSNRGSAMAAHYKKCPAQQQTIQNRPVTREDKSAAPSITPKKKAAKRRISGHDFEVYDDEGTSQANESDTESQPGSPQLRRSKRFKTESKRDGKEPKPTNEAEPIDLTRPMARSDGAVPTPADSASLSESDDFPLSEFDLVAHCKRLKCKHCQSEVSFREDVAEQHLGECEAYKASRTPATQAVPTKSQKRGKGSDRDSGTSNAAITAMLRHPERLRGSDVVEMDHETALAWIFGPQRGDEMRNHLGMKSPVVVRSSVSRFRVVEHLLADLDVCTMVSQVQTKITAMLPQLIHNARQFSMVPCTSASVAMDLYDNGAPLVFRAPDMIVRMFIPPLAKELRCGSMMATDMHNADVLCASTRIRFDWQYQNTDLFVVCLRGKALWKLHDNAIKLPPNSFQLASTERPNRESVVSLQVASLGVGSGLKAVPVPNGAAFDFSNDSDGEDEMETTNRTVPAKRQDERATSQQIVADAGAVVYIPTGTWYCVDGLEDNAIWLQFGLKKVTLGQVLSAAVSQLVVSQAKFREHLDETQDGDTAIVEQHVVSSMRDLCLQLMSLSGGELLPSLLISNQLTPAAVVGEIGGEHAIKVYNFNLTDPNGFDGGPQIVIFKRSAFRVSPLAVLMSAEELPALLKNATSTTVDSHATGATGSVTPTPKKALNRKTKRGPGSVASSTQFAGPSNGSVNQKSEGKYILHVGLGGDGHPRVKVQFWCSPAQQAMVDWIRTRDTADPFRVSELAKVLAHYQGGKADMEMIKFMLRFLCMTGYLANVDVSL